MGWARALCSGPPRSAFRGRPGPARPPTGPGGPGGGLFPHPAPSRIRGQAPGPPPGLRPKPRRAMSPALAATPEPLRDEPHRVRGTAREGQRTSPTGVGAQPPWNPAHRPMGAGAEPHRVRGGDRRGPGHSPTGGRGSAPGFGKGRGGEQPPGQRPNGRAKPTEPRRGHRPREAHDSPAGVRGTAPDSGRAGWGTDPRPAAQRQSQTHRTKAGAPPPRSPRQPRTGPGHSPGFGKGRSGEQTPGQRPNGRAKPTEPRRGHHPREAHDSPARVRGTAPDSGRGGVGNRPPASGPTAEPNPRNQGGGTAPAKPTTAPHGSGAQPRIREGAEWGTDPRPAAQRQSQTHRTKAGAPPPRSPRQPRRGPERSPGFGKGRGGEQTPGGACCQPRKSAARRSAARSRRAPASAMQRAGSGSRSVRT